MASERIIDPVCDMIVDLTDAREHGLTLEYPEREYGFCAAGCLAKFAKNPSAYKAKVDGWLASQVTRSATVAHSTSGETPVIDAGMRAWYSSCRCCLSDAHPSVVEVLDRELAHKEEARETETT